MIISKKEKVDNNQNHENKKPIKISEEEYQENQSLGNENQNKKTIDNNTIENDNRKTFFDPDFNEHIFLKNNKTNKEINESINKIDSNIRDSAKDIRKDLNSDLYQNDLFKREGVSKSICFYDEFINFEQSVYNSEIGEQRILWQNILAIEVKRPHPLYQYTALHYKVILIYMDSDEPVIMIPPEVLTQIIDDSSEFKVCLISKKYNKILYADIQFLQYFARSDKKFLPIDETSKAIINKIVLKSNEINEKLFKHYKNHDKPGIFYKFEHLLFRDTFFTDNNISEKFFFKNYPVVHLPLIENIDNYPFSKYILEYWKISKNNEQIEDYTPEYFRPDNISRYLRELNEELKKREKEGLKYKTPILENKKMLEDPTNIKEIDRRVNDLENLLKSSLDNILKFTDEKITKSLDKLLDQDISLKILENSISNSFQPGGLQNEQLYSYNLDKLRSKFPAIAELIKFQDDTDKLKIEVTDCYDNTFELRLTDMNSELDGVCIDHSHDLDTPRLIGSSILHNILDLEDSNDFLVYIVDAHYKRILKSKSAFLLEDIIGDDFEKQDLIIQTLKVVNYLTINSGINKSYRIEYMVKLPLDYVYSFLNSNNLWKLGVKKADYIISIHVWDDENKKYIEKYPNDRSINEERVDEYLEKMKEVDQIWEKAFGKTQANNEDMDKEYWSDEDKDKEYWSHEDKDKEYWSHEDKDKEYWSHESNKFDEEYPENEGEDEDILEEELESDEEDWENNSYEDEEEANEDENKVGGKEKSDNKNKEEIEKRKKKISEIIGFNIDKIKPLPRFDLPKNSEIDITQTIHADINEEKSIFGNEFEKFLNFDSRNFIINEKTGKNLMEGKRVMFELFEKS